MLLQDFFGKRYLMSLFSLVKRISSVWCPHAGCYSVEDTEPIGFNVSQECWAKARLWKCSRNVQKLETQFDIKIDAHLYLWKKWFFINRRADIRQHRLFGESQFDVKHWILSPSRLSSCYVSVLENSFERAWGLARFWHVKLLQSIISEGKHMFMCRCITMFLWALLLKSHVVVLWCTMYWP